MMTPLQAADITQRDFTTVGIGYDPDQVRAFLSTVAQSFEELNAPDPSRAIESQVAAILAEARSAARATIDSALDEAVTVRRRTEDKLEELRWNAGAEASRRRQEALERAEEILSVGAGDGESGTDAAIELSDVMKRRLLELHGVVKKARRLRSELQTLHSVSSSLRKLLDSNWARDDAPIRVVIVCTLNRFRSPIAAEILKGEAAELGFEDLIVSSRGTDAPHGYAASSEARTCAGRLGIDLTWHRSKRLSRADVALADLVVVMEQRHAKVVRELHPWANVVFLGDLRDIDLSTPATEGFAPLGQITSKRGGHEIRDPRPRSKSRTYERCVEEMSPYLHALAQFLAGLAHDMHGYRRGRHRFEDMATEKGELHAAHS
jgi:DivIVA domain-containing protein